MKAIILFGFVLVAGSAAGQDPAVPPLPAPAADQPRPASPRGVVSGRVISGGGQPASDASVELVELGRTAAVAADGSFRFDNVPPGTYLLQAHGPRSGSAVLRIELTADAGVALDVMLDRAQHSETVVVSASVDAAALSDVALPVSVLSGPELVARLQPTLGETLAQQPGVSSTYFGPGASRPVIRGLGGDRIRILQSGVGTADASSTSPDHAVSFDPLGAAQIEVVRGPATLLYGSNAVGGIVNVLDDRVPDTTPERALSGRAALSGASAADERTGALSLNGGRGAFAWHADVSKRKADDVAIPGFAESAALREEEGEEGQEHEEVTGVLENSAVDNTSGALGASLVGSRGYLGLALSGMDSLYGVPGHHHGQEEEGAPAEEEAGVRVDLRQRRADVRGGWHQPTRFLRGVKLRLGLADYEHKELEGEEIGTVFTNESWEGRLEASHQPLGPFSGSIGVQTARRDFEAMGEEAFVPPTLTRSFAVFAFEEARSGSWRFQVGGRAERQTVEARGEEALDRDFDGLSGSVGLIWAPEGAWSAAVTVARSVKLPNAEELFSNGPHLATGSFEIGDPALGKERSLGVDVSLRRRAGRLTGALNLFLNRFDGFIFEEITGQEEDGLQVVRFTQRDADFRGAEAELRVDLVHAEPHHLHADLSADYVRAELRATAEALPRIPPFRYGVGLHYDSESWSGRVELRGAASQDRLAAFERPTDGYALVNASIGRRFFRGRTVFELSLRGTNLTDQDARTHVSFLKDVAPLPGRDVRIDARLSF